ncbi:MAG TPA: TA system VapC family ribonuclease toxin [Polyangiaceae bacterium]|nr:TA system VapC family ribonuclease toxin [Polyangiaceae bacterium]
MIAVDTNVLVYAHRSDAPFHESAARMVRELAEGSRPWAIPWPCVHEFLAKVTHARIFKNPTPLAHALEQVAEWLRSPMGRAIGEPEDYLGVLSKIILDSQVAGAKVHDARIAALCIAHGVTELWSADRDFSRFSALRVRNPL